MLSNTMLAILSVLTPERLNKNRGSMREEIHSAAKEALVGGIMDEEIYDGDLLDSLVSSSNSISKYLDIPIRDLIALRQRDFYKSGSTWREAALGLHCNAWDGFRDKIVDYFLSDLKDNPFPAPNSSQELRIGFAGGAMYCKLGNHRVVAAKAWLARNYSEDAILKKAKCYFYTVSQPLKELMEQSIKSGSRLKHAFVPYEYASIRDEGICHLITEEHKSLSCDLYSLNKKTDRLDLILPSNKPITRLFRNDLRAQCLRLDFKTIAPSLIKLILDDGNIPSLMMTTPIRE